MTTYYILIYIAIVLAAAGQVMLKMSSNRKGFKLLTFNLNLWVPLALVFMILSMFLSVRALKVVPLRDMAFILPTVYILVPLFARIFLKERLHRQTIIGTFIIIIGMLIFNLPLV
jgi:drug/metabolite transporter (DMT)-like permease